MFKINNLDEAGYLLYCGMAPDKIKVVGPQHCDFSYKGKAAVKLVESYRTGKLLVNPQRFMYCRTMLKKDIATEIFRNKAALENTPIERYPVPVTAGMKYWFIENNKVQSQVYGDRPPHSVRLNEGNFYLSKALADSELKNNLEVEKDDTTSHLT